MPVKKKSKTNEQKFDKTVHGKKLLKNMITWTIILMVGIAIEFALYVCGNDDMELIASFFTLINALIFAISMYVDGKYQGALEMYNKRLK